MPHVQVLEDEIRKSIVLLLAKKRSGVKEYGMNDLLVFPEIRYFSARGGKTWVVRRVFCCFWW